eukprot:CAMPEP_0185019160 /NCGR_PEP_ID=MMETSP1103-20130426/1791_1 /TAXON_ID=36769 /ORGANISM="Paraphysomonas bandaiensis, Strain Caron Lab Isolate" /LENGTH=177 /DNA_ID=CAMNT_0027549331 /DNA_START=302 /DNA_END=835 /DNA_ORIENTATION=+
MLHQMSLKRVYDLAYVCAWIGHRLGVALNFHEARHLVQYVGLCASDTETMLEQGYIDLTPPQRSKYKLWRVNLGVLAEQRLSNTTMSEKDNFLPVIHRQKTSPAPAQLKKAKSHRRSSHSGAVGGNEVKNLPNISTKRGLADLVEDLVDANRQLKQSGSGKCTTARIEVHGDYGIYS